MSRRLCTAGAGANSLAEVLGTERSFDDGLLSFLRLNFFPHCYPPDLTDKTQKLVGPTCDNQDNFIEKGSHYLQTA